LGKNEIWNVNFPDCSVEECKGIKYDCIVSQDDFCVGYDLVSKDGDKKSYKVNFERHWSGSEGTDLAAIIGNYVSVSKVKNYS
jgi:5'-nucleotidase